ncbi:efflux RND transporter periplasmic adaptor subunit [Aestuariibacter salexigens]|uniref:efflux RND transporter periplasmic adaptor subunit n=1 Tax=Aestuariibacter salexigens TaxID=226010 RepID=UPI00041C2D9D|nr:efflux RND transporter periplasmic adaptor subunit [Aestuariibacter salexigens]
MKNMKKTWLAIPFSLLMVSVQAQQPGEPEPPLVETDIAKAEMIAEQIWVPGTVVSRVDADIAAEVTGRLIWIAEVGESVEKGDVLARIDDHRLTLEHEQNEANVLKWQSRVNLLERKQQRFSAMLKNNSGSRDEYDEAMSELEVAKQELAQAQINTRLTRYQLDRTEVKAPFKAMVVERLQVPGEFTGVGQNVLRIVDMDNIEASIRAPLSAVPYLTSNMEVTVSGRNIERQESIRAIVPVGNASSRMMEVRVALQPGDFAIGSAVRVALPHSDYHLATTVPRDALVLRKAGAFIYALDDQDNALQIPVATGIGVGERIEIIGAVDTDVRVITRGAERLRNGQKVRIQDETSLASRS